MVMLRIAYGIMAVVSMIVVTKLCDIGAILSDGSSASTRWRRALAPGKTIEGVRRHAVCDFRRLVLDRGPLSARFSSADRPKRLGSALSSTAWLSARRARSATLPNPYQARRFA